MKLSKWIKPNSNEVRFYINEESSVFGKKAFIADEDGRWTIKCFDLSRGQLDSLMNSVEDFMASLNSGERPVYFSDVLAILN